MNKTAESSTSTLSLAEGDIVDYDFFLKEEKSIKLPPRNTEYYYQEYPYVKPTQSAFDRKEVKGSKLFDKTKQIKTEETLPEDEVARDASILVSGFGMRNVDSFQKLIQMSHEERQKWELKKLWRDSTGLQEKQLLKFKSPPEQPSSTESSTSTETRSKKSSSDLLTQTETTFTGEDKMRHLDYLLGLDTAAEEEPEPAVESKPTECEDDFKYSSSKSVRDAQRYLRTHRIFECFQFIVAHLLSANAENPIEFIINLLNRCLLYRSGLGAPPVLYEQKHIGKLFDLMDRLQTGFIDQNQYVAGMKTFGVCSFNKNPPVNAEDLVSKETFVDEAYEAELAIFDDLIKRRPEKTKFKERKSQSVLNRVSNPSLNPPYFIPSDLFKFSKHSLDNAVVVNDIDG
ncbi:uncharacterized protein LOC109539786 [Dendroctonus ponderosae]|uniref:EF-hand domain-containing protein n=1 Tax=Dendroctonus ponderosae TaxID=77166 RepID=A0AAR5PQN2_DENPD|nr:uncharacterized protein LOC109539786 [Dendroctonus ponderosae]